MTRGSCFGHHFLLYLLPTQDVAMWEGIDYHLLVCGSSWRHGSCWMNSSIFFIMQRCSATGIVTSFPSEKVWFAEETRHQVARRGGDFQWKGAKVRGFHSNFSAFPCHQIVMNYLNNMLRTNFGHFSGANEGSNCAMIKSWSDRRPCFVQSLA